MEQPELVMQFLTVLGTPLIGAKSKKVSLGTSSRLFSDFWGPAPGDFLETFWLLAPTQRLPWEICRSVLEDFCCINFGGFSRGFSWRIFLGTFSHKDEEKKSGDRIREKIRRPKNKNPRKICSAKNRP